MLIEAEKGMARGMDKEVHIKGICLKVNVMVRLEFELVYFDIAVEYVKHSAMGTSQTRFSLDKRSTRSPTLISKSGE